MSGPLYEDPVIAEVHAIRAQMLAECGGDHRKLMERVDEHERASGRTVIPPPPAARSGAEQPTPACVGSAGLANPEDAADFVKEVIPNSPDSGTPRATG